MMETILEVRNLQIQLKKKKQKIMAVEHVSFGLKKGETLGIIGESGSGKSLTCMSVMGLLDKKQWEVDGTMAFQGKEIALNDRRSLAEIRGSRIALIMQNPMSAFNPVITIEKHFRESLNRSGNKKMSRRDVRKTAAELLEKLHIRDPEAVLSSYSFQLSGGMLQRIMIALALAVKPDILIADEPTTALDLTVQHEIIKILEELQKEYGMAILMISHDLGVIRHLSDRIAVMYAGNLVEEGAAQEILDHPEHPYTRGLFSSRPAFSKDRLQVMEGQPPALEERGDGCRFYPRCSLRCEACLRYTPKWNTEKQEHMVCCLRYEEGIEKYGVIGNKSGKKEV